MLETLDIAEPTLADSENEELAKAVTKVPKLTSLKDNVKVFEVVLDPSVTLTVKECEVLTS